MFNIAEEVKNKLYKENQNLKWALALAIKHLKEDSKQIIKPILEEYIK